MAMFLPLHDCAIAEIPQSSGTTGEEAGADEQRCRTRQSVIDENKSGSVSGESSASLPMNTTTSQLAEGFTDDGRLSKYDNLRYINKKSGKKWKQQQKRALSSSITAKRPKKASLDKHQEQRSLAAEKRRRQQQRRLLLVDEQQQHWPSPVEGGLHSQISLSFSTSSTSSSSCSLGLSKSCSSSNNSSLFGLDSNKIFKSSSIASAPFEIVGLFKQHRRGTKMIGNRNHIPQLGAYSDRRYSAEYGQSFSPGYGRPPGSPFSFTGGAPHSPTSNSEQHQQQRRFSSTRFSAGCFARVKHWYDHSAFRHVAPFLLLWLYAVLGACIFYLIEHDNEVWLVRREQEQLDSLRNQTFLKLRRVFALSNHQNRFYHFSSSRMIRNADYRQQFESAGILRWYEKQVVRIKLPEALEWDIWGALFYVGTVFTTIGYGNITPRTTQGRALSILYAIIGIPLVLAILSQFSKLMTKFLSDIWIKYRKKVLKAKANARKASLINNDIEKGNVEKDEHGAEIESKTIPVWLALSLCIGYICLIAATFLIWEKRWSYFTSFYFICISCLTIGLGDITPDHPRLLILMFVFVIIGLSFVSMLLSVIQIKMEEWLYRMMIKMHKEFQKALDQATDSEEREKIIEELMKNEPWFMRNLAPMIVGQDQADKIEHMAENYERVLHETNNKCIQTEVPPFAQPQVEIDWKPSNQSIRLAPPAETDKLSVYSLQSGPMLSAHETFEWAPFDRQRLHQDVAVQQRGASVENSISEVASLPTDPAMQVCLDRSAQADLPQPLPPGCDRSMQTEIAQFQIDELAVKLRLLQQEKEKARAKKMQTAEKGTNAREVLIEQSIQTEQINAEGKDEGVQVRPLIKVIASRQ